MKRPDQMAEAALSLLKKGGAQQASADVQAVEKREFNVESGVFSLYRSTVDARLSLTAIRDHRRGVVSSNGLEDEAVGAAARECLDAAASAQPDEAWELSDRGGGRYEDGADEARMEELLERTRGLMADVAREYPRVILEQLIVSHTRVLGAYRNSRGVAYDTLRGYYEADLMFTAREGERSSSFHGASLRLSSLGEPLIGLGSLRMNLKAVERGIDTVPVWGKFQGSLVLTPDCLADFMGSLLGNFVSDSVILEGTSLWKDSLGRQVADERLTLRMAPRDPAIVCGERYSPEGYPSEDYCVLENGVLRHFMLSRYVANKTGRDRAPNASFDLVIPGGDTDLEALIGSIPRGLLVGRFSGGQPGVNGDFSGVAKNSFLIEEGRVTHGVSETMINGNLRDMLFALRGLSRQRVANGLYVLPWMAVDGITVSGK